MPATGCLIGTPASMRARQPPQIEAIDTLAAGDVFHGAFAFSLVEGWQMSETIAFASAAAALKCTRFGGAYAAPQRTEVEAFLGEHVDARPA